jgi:hypothetical protein
VKTSNTAKISYIHRRIATKSFGYFLRAAMISIPKNCGFDIFNCNKLKTEM